MPNNNGKETLTNPNVFFHTADEVYGKGFTKRYWKGLEKKCPKKITAKTHKNTLN